MWLKTTIATTDTLTDVNSGTSSSDVSQYVLGAAGVAIAGSGGDVTGVDGGIITLTQANDTDYTFAVGDVIPNY